MPRESSQLHNFIIVIMLSAFGLLHLVHFQYPERPQPQHAVRLHAAHLRTNNDVLPSQEEVEPISLQPPPAEEAQPVDLQLLRAPHVVAAKPHRKKKSRLAFVNAFFGTAKPHLAFFLRSVANSNFDVILFGDIVPPHSLPSNVIQVHMTWQECIARIARIVPECFTTQQEVKDFTQLKNIAKIIDFRPLLGELLHDELQGYEMWGFGDNDMVMGNLSMPRGLTDSVVSAFDIIPLMSSAKRPKPVWGPATFFRNEPRVNCLFHRAPNLCEMLTDERQWYFDEFQQKRQEGQAAGNNMHAIIANAAQDPQLNLRVFSGWENTIVGWDGLDFVIEPENEVMTCELHCDEKKGGGCRTFRQCGKTAALKCARVEVALCHFQYSKDVINAKIQSMSPDELQRLLKSEVIFLDSARGFYRPTEAQAKHALMRGVSAHATDSRWKWLTNREDVKARLFRIASGVKNAAVATRMPSTMAEPRGNVAGASRGGGTGDESVLVEANVRAQLETAFSDVENVRAETAGKGVLERSRRLGVQLRSAAGFSVAEMRRLELTAAFVSGRVLYFISPTVERPSQMVDLMRLSQTLQLVALTTRSVLLWIVVEDRPRCSRRVRDVVQRSGLDFVHVAVPTTADGFNKHGKQLKGLEQRNRAIQEVRRIQYEGVVYFGDDDNGYDVQMFVEIARVRVVGVFPVGFVGGSVFERCEVDPRTGRVARFHSNFLGNKAGTRTYAVDMAGMAFSTAALLERNLLFQRDWPPGFMETRLLESVVSSIDELEPLAGNCTRVLAWHVRTDTKEANRKSLPSDAEFDLLSRLV